MWNLIAQNWSGITSLIALAFSIDAERRVYSPVEWSLSKATNEGWMLKNEGWLTERDIRIEPKQGVTSQIRGKTTLKRHESAMLIISRTEIGMNVSTICVSSRRLLRRHHRQIALYEPGHDA